MKSTDCKKKKKGGGSHLSAVCDCTKHVTLKSSSSVHHPAEPRRWRLWVCSQNLNTSFDWCQNQYLQEGNYYCHRQLGVQMIIATLRRVLREAAHVAAFCHMWETHSRLAAGWLYKPHITVTSCKRTGFKNLSMVSVTPKHLLWMSSGSLLWKKCVRMISGVLGWRSFIYLWTDTRLELRSHQPLLRLVGS